ncbi:hypothetical protein ACWGLG_20970 [Streptomyces antimycoticus]
MRELGAADASDAVFAGGGWCPIADLEHADMAYEWMYGGSALSSGEVVDQTVSKQVSAAFSDYQASLRLRGKQGFGPLTARNYDDYLLRTYLQPAATRYLTALPDADRAAYLATNAWITWSGGRARFAWADSRCTSSGTPTPAGRATGGSASAPVRLLRDRGTGPTRTRVTSCGGSVR